MKKEVKIKISSVQTVCGGEMFEQTEDCENSDNSIVVSNAGTMEYENGKFLLEYEETELTGMPGTVTRLEFDENDRCHFIMRREGQTCGTMYFSPGERYVTSYDTGIIPIQITLSTASLKNSIDWFGGKAHIEYDLEIHGMCAEHTVLDIEVS